MAKFEEYQEHIQYTHNAFCRIVIRHASIDAARKLYLSYMDFSNEAYSDIKIVTAVAFAGMTL